MDPLSDKIRRTANRCLCLFLDPALRVVEYIIAAVCVVMVSVVFVQVVLRYVFNSSFFGAEELARFLFTWFIFMSATLALELKMHFSVEVFVALLPRPVRRALSLFSYLTVLSILSILTVQGVKYTVGNWHQLSPAMHVPFSYTNAAIPLSCGLMFLITLRHMINLNQAKV